MSEPGQVLQAALELGDEWEDELQKRVRDVDSGQVLAVPGEEVLSRIEQRLRDR